MALRKLAKDRDSGKHGCPTVYLDEDALAEGDTVMLVLQGEVVTDGGPSTDQTRRSATRCAWLPEGTVLALGDRLPAEREHELENLLTGEAAVTVPAADLLGEPRLGRVDDLDQPRTGQVLLRIKAETVQAARARYHASPA